MMKGKEQKKLSKEQLSELEAIQAETVGLTRLSDRSVKPPQWYEVEKIMFPNAAAQKKATKKAQDGMEVDPDPKKCAEGSGCVKREEAGR